MKKIDRGQLIDWIDNQITEVNSNMALYLKAPRELSAENFEASARTLAIMAKELTNRHKN